MVVEKFSNYTCSGGLFYRFRTVPGTLSLPYEKVYIIDELGEYTEPEELLVCVEISTVGGGGARYDRNPLCVREDYKGGVVYSSRHGFIFRYADDRFAISTTVHRQALIAPVIIRTVSEWRFLIPYFPQGPNNPPSIDILYIKPNTGTNVESSALGLFLQCLYVYVSGSRL